MLEARWRNIWKVVYLRLVVPMVLCSETERDLWVILNCYFYELAFDLI